MKMIVIVCLDVIKYKVLFNVKPDVLRPEVASPEVKVVTPEVHLLTQEVNVLTPEVHLLTPEVDVLTRK